MTSYLLPTRVPDLLLKPTDWCAICRDPLYDGEDHWTAGEPRCEAHCPLCSPECCSMRGGPVSRVCSRPRCNRPRSKYEHLCAVCLREEREDPPKRRPLARYGG